jgi:hypothetical protein
MRSTRLTLLALCALAAVQLSACGAREPRSLELPQRFTVQFRESAPMLRETLPAPLEQVWAAVPGAVAAVGLPAGAASNERHLFITPHLRITGRLYEGMRNSEFLDCGVSDHGEIRADTHLLVFSVITRVTPAPGGGSVVSIQLDGSAQPRTTSRGVLPCDGTGKLERAILEGIRSRLASG